MKGAGSCPRDEGCISGKWIGAGQVMNNQVPNRSPSPALGRGEPRAWCFWQLPAFLLVSFLSIFLASPPSISAVPADWRARAQEALSRGDLDDARRAAELGLQSPSSGGAAHELLGYISYRQKKNEEAIAHFQAASRDGRSGLELTKNWSAALLALGRHLEGRELLEKALAQDSSQTDLRYRLAGSYSTEGKWKEAWPHWEMVYGQGLRHSGVVLQLARARFAAGQDVEAVELLNGFVASTAAMDPLFEAGKLLFEPLRREVRSRVKLVPMESIPILPAALGRDVGILGAAAVALDA